MSDHEDLSIFGPECASCAKIKTDGRDDPCDDCTAWIGKFSSENDANMVDDME